MRTLDLAHDYISDYQAVLHEVEKHHNLFDRLDDCMFLKMAALLGSKDAYEQKRAKGYMLELHTQNRLVLTAEQIRQFCVDVYQDNLEVIKKVDELLNVGKLNESNNQAKTEDISPDTNPA